MYFSSLYRQIAIKKSLQHKTIDKVNIKIKLMAKSKDYINYTISA